MSQQKGTAFLRICLFAEWENSSREGARKTQVETDGSPFWWEKWAGRILMEETTEEKGVFRASLRKKIKGSNGDPSDLEQKV